MTYAELLEQLQNLTEDELACDVVAEDLAEDECWPVKRLDKADVEHPSLDENHPVLVF